jgi:hypothetical protein
VADDDDAPLLDQDLDDNYGEDHQRRGQKKKHAYRKKGKKAQRAL